MHKSLICFETFVLVIVCCNSVPTFRHSVRFCFFFFKWPVLSVSFGLVFGNIYHLLVAIDRSMCVACVDGIIHALSENEDRVA